MWQLHVGSGEDSQLEKIPFARINNGIFMFKRGESDSTVYPGLYTVTTTMANAAMDYSYILLVINI